MPEHCIENLHFEVDFESAEQAFEAQERTAAFARARVPTIIEEVFDAHTQVGEVWRLDTLDIDLGGIDADELETQWEQRLRERLAETLETCRAVARGQALAQPPHIDTPNDGAQGTQQQTSVVAQSRPQAQLATLLHFLRHGHLPWHAVGNGRSSAALDALFLDVLRDKPQALVAAIRNPGPALLMAQRAARQFSSGSLALLATEMARALGAGVASGWGREAEAWIAGFAMLWRHSELPGAPASHLVWQGLLNALLMHAGAADRSEPLQSMVQSLAPSVAEQAAIWRALQTVARRALDGMPPAPALRDDVLRACLAAHLPGLGHPDGTQADPLAGSRSRSDELTRLHTRLHTWLDPQGPQAHPPLGDSNPDPWHELLHAERSWARQTLLQLGRSVAARRRMAQTLPAATLQALMALWLAPAEQDLLQAVVPSDAFWGPPPGALDPAQRWEMTLGYVLLHPAPSLFNGSEYLDAMLLQRSESENQSLPALRQAVVYAWRNSPRPQHDTAPALALVQTWLKRHAPAPDAIRATRTTTRRAQLEQALQHGLLLGVEDAWFEALSDDAPWLQTQVRTSMGSPRLRRRIAREWSGVARAQLISLWLPAPDCAAIVAAVHNPAFAALAGDDHPPALHLWEDLLEHLLRLTPGTFFNADAYVRGLHERADHHRGHTHTAQRVASDPALAIATLHQMAPPTDASPANPHALAPLSSSDEDPLAALAQVLLNPDNASGPSACMHTLEPLLHAPSAPARQAWLRILETPRAAECLLRLAPLRVLTRVLDWLKPHDSAAVHHSLALLHDACERVGPSLHLQPIATLQWRFVLRELFEEGRRFEPSGFALRMVHHLADTLRPPQPATWFASLGQAVVDAGDTMVGQALTQAAAAQQPPLHQVPTDVARRHTELIAETLAAEARRPPSEPLPWSPSNTPEQHPPGESIYIANAGLVLAGGYMQRLFGMLGLANNEAFVSDAARERAVMLLQYLVSGESSAPESQLALNKLLCGVPLSMPVLREIEVLPTEAQAIDGLLKAMIAHWKIIGQTSVAGLRESFLMREGQLSQDDEDWQLLVEPRAFDMLLDHLPWGFHLLKFPWTERPLHVDWR